MAKSSTSFTSETAGRTKPRGPSKRTLLLNAIKKQAQLDEVGFYEVMVQRALNPEDPHSGMLIKEVMSRLFPASKPTMPIVEFEFPIEASATERVAYIERAIANGSIPADVAKIMVDIIRAGIEIEKVTELAERIESIEAMLNESDNDEEKA